jgi:hypothetical protein
MPLASGVAFMIKAITNNTYGHHGEMAFPEITLVPWNTTTDKAQTGYTYTEKVTSEWRFESTGPAETPAERVKHQYEHPLAMQ